MAVAQAADDKSKSQAAKVTFAKLLAGNNKKIRDKGLKKLNAWLTLRSNSQYVFTEEDLMTIWTGLYYSMWMSDLPLVQEDLAESISMLIHCLKSNTDAALLFIKCFNVTIGQAWGTIDQHRIDKFAMLVRRFLRQSLHLMDNLKWDLPTVKNLMSIYKEHVLGDKITLGFKLHFMEIFLEELSKVSKGELSAGVLMAVLEPFARTGVLTADGRVRMQCETFFRHLIKQTDVGIEYQEKFDAWKQAGFPGGDPNLMVKHDGHDDEVEDDSEDDEVEEEDAEDEEEEGEVQEEAAEDEEDEEGEVQEEAEEDDEEEEEGEVEAASTSLDPRAGSVHTYLPQLRPPAQRLSKLMKRLSTEPQAPVKGKRLMLALHRRFKALQRGKYPFAVGKIFSNGKENLGQMVNDAVQRELKEEALRKAKRKHFKLIRQKGKIKANEIKQKKKEERKLAKMSKKKQRENAKAGFIVTEEKNSSQKRKNDDAELPPGWIVDSIDWQPPSKKKQSNLWEVSSDVSNSGKKVVKSPKAQEPAKEPLETKKTSPKSPAKRATSMMSTPTKAIKLDDTPSGPSETNKENGGEQVIVIENTKKTPQKIPAFFSHAAAKVNKPGSKKKSPIAVAIGTPNSLLKETLVASLNSSKVGRRISFNLAKNMAQEKAEHFEQLERSPQIPYDANRVPQQSALKQGLPPSPINPFYAMKLGLYKKL